MTRSKIEFDDNTGEMFYHPKFDDDDMELIHSALDVLVEWLKGTLYPFPEVTGLQTEEEHPVDVAVVMRPAMLIRAKHLRKWLVSMTGENKSIIANMADPNDPESEAGEDGD